MKSHRDTRIYFENSEKEACGTQLKGRCEMLLLALSTNRKKPESFQIKGVTFLLRSQNNKCNLEMEISSEITF